MPHAIRPARVLRASAIGIVAVVGLSGLLFFVVGVDLLDHAAHLPGCLFRALTGIDCPGCGMTRAFLLLGQLRISEALRLHPLAPALLALIVATAIGASPARFLQRRFVPATAWVLVLGVWLQRLAT